MESCESNLRKIPMITTKKNFNRKCLHNFMKRFAFPEKSRSLYAKFVQSVFLFSSLLLPPTFMNFNRNSNRKIRRYRASTIGMPGEFDSALHRGSCAQISLPEHISRSYFPFSQMTNWVLTQNHFEL